MADLPDLTTEEIGFIAFWNALDDGGVSSIEASDVLSAGAISEYDLYDNGVEGLIQIGNHGREFSWRAKDDGWIIAYFDRTNEYDTRQSNVGTRGYYDLARQWPVYSSLDDFSQHALERAIQALASELDNWGSIIYNTADVGLFNFEFPDATATTGFATMRNNESKDSSFLFTAGTTLHYASAVASDSDSSNPPTVSFEGTTIVSGTNEVGTLDLLSFAPDPDTEYTVSANNNSNYSGNYFSTSVLTVWE